ncbi:MAG: hypothetical protein IVW54_09360 [Candidatus Binataceae bacterium]|nr:hypothetical protein [Candidatus Binataceae bacterium]
MAALTSARNTPEMADFGRIQVYPVEANTVVYLGSMVALNGAGNAVPASSTPGLKIVGRAERVHNGIPGQNAVNTGGVAGGISIVCRRGVFMYAVNDSSIAQAQIGSPAFAVDDNSVSASDGSASSVVAATAFTFPVAGTPQLIVLNHEYVSKVVVTSDPAGTTYVEGTDYVVDYQSGLVMRTAASAIAAGAQVLISFDWGAPSRSIAGQIVNLDPSGEVWIDFWHQSTLAI